MKIYITTGVCQLDASGDPGAGCVEAAPVVESLAITRDVLQLRGEWELQKIGYDWRDYTATGPDIGNYVTGALVEVEGTDFGNMLGKIVSISYNDAISGSASSVTLTIRILK